MTKTGTEWISTTRNEQWVSRAADTTAGMLPTLHLTGRKLQTISYFGGCFNELGWKALSKLPDETRDGVFAELFGKDGCRFNMGRFPIGASDYALEWYSLDEYDSDYGMEHFTIERDKTILIPYIRKALDVNPDLKLFASPWSPPTWMKFPKAYNYGRIIWEDKNLRAYALYFLKFIKAYENQGVAVNQIHVQNEPMADQKFPSCLWSGEHLRDFIKLYLGPLFIENRVRTEIWLGTINANNDHVRMMSDYDELSNTVLSDPDALRYISGVGYQWGGKQAIQRTHESWPEMPLMQTENECGDGANTWEYAQYVFSLMKHYFTNGVLGYIYWNMVLEPEGMSTWGWKQNSMLTVDATGRNVLYNPEFYVIKHASHFVVPGSRLLETRGASSGNTLTFLTPDGSVVFITANPFTKTKPFSVTGEGVSVSVELPADSINTIVVGMKG